MRYKDEIDVAELNGVSDSMFMKSLNILSSFSLIALLSGRSASYRSKDAVTPSNISRVSDVDLFLPVDASQTPFLA